MATTSLGELLASGGRSFSFEFFPPKTDDGERALWTAIRELEPLNPSFVSVTYGAGGSTRDRTVRVTERIAEDTTLTPVAHLTCVGASEAGLHEVIAQYAAAGIRNVLALRGDPPGGPGAPWEQHPGGFTHAVELVALLRSLGSFSIGVAAFPEGHPESTSLEHDAQVLAAKAEAGAEFAITQFFFRAADYFSLVERAAAHGCTIPILPGVMPVTNISQITRFAELSGTAVPGEIADRFLALGDDPEGVRALGVEVATQLCVELLDGGAPGIHFYTLNRSNSTKDVFNNLNVHSRR